MSPARPFSARQPPAPEGGALTRRSALLGAGLLLTGCSRADQPDAPGEAGSPGAGASAGASATSAPPSRPEDDGRGQAPADVVAALQGQAATDWGLNLPGTVTTMSSGPVALTFDACGGPAGSGVDRDLLRLLRDERIPATLFLNARWIEANPTLAAELAREPQFLLASHGARHLPLSVSGESAYGIAGTEGIREVVDELTSADAWFREHTGKSPLWFRSGTAYTDDVSVRAAQMLGRSIAGFTVNADGGAQFGPGQVEQELLGLEPGGIVLAHMNQPRGGTAEGLAAALPILRDRGIEFATLP